nr:proline-rich receptor-like protein kinase PERK8 [Ipomoea batatas]
MNETYQQYVDFSNFGHNIEEQRFYYKEASAVSPLFILQGTMDSKKPDGKTTPKRKSKILAEITRQEMLRARRAANGGHEVGDTPSDPLVLISEDEEMEPAKPVEKPVNEHPDSLSTGDDSPPREPGEFIYFTTSDSDLSSQASRASSTYSKSESSTAFSTNRKK